MSFFPPPLVATSIAQFQHILFFGLLRRHKRRIICSIFLVATFLFFRAPGRHNLLSNSRFGYGLLFSYSAERVRSNLRRIVCVLDRVPPKPLRNLYKCFTCFFRRPSTSIVITVEYFQQMFSGCHKRCHLLRNSNTWFSRASESAHPLRSCNTFIYFAPLGRHIRCAISTSVFLSPPFVATS